ncbi:MAG: hypothetical protein VKK04_25710 [Synechococcales bacterium]|nr:hypothetical protein [Synechococcales bacterium]
MEQIRLNEDNEVSLKVVLTKYQVSKFNSLASNLVIKNGVAYVPSTELHGVLLTRSRQRAKEIVNAYRNTLRIYLIEAHNLEIDGDDPYIRPIGLQILLDQLSIDNPRRATEYRASAALLTYIVANYPQLAIEDQIRERDRRTIQAQVWRNLKRRHTCCQLTGRLFNGETEKHIHHIIAESIRPDLAASENNLIVISGEVHDEYHAWVTAGGYEVNKATLRNFARRKGYSLAWDNFSS